MTAPSHDPVDHPKHYTTHPSGVECIEINEHLPANLACAFKYVFRHRDKDAELQDLQKASWYLRRELDRRRKYVITDEAPPPNVIAKALLVVAYEADPDVSLALASIVGASLQAGKAVEHALIQAGLAVTALLTRAEKLK